MTLLVRRRVASAALALVALVFACADDEDPTLDAEAIRARCLADAPPAPDTTITGGRWTSPCGAGPCDLRLTIESICVTYETRGESGEILQVNHGTLTDAGRERGVASAKALVGVDVPGIVGECDDEATCEVRRLTMIRAGEGSSHELRGGATAAELAEALAHLEALRRALAACEGDGAVIVASHCERE